MQDLLLLISSILLIPHIAYGGYFILARLKKIDPLVMMAGAAVGVSLVFMVLNIPNPLLWAVYLGIAFVFAILFHLRIKSLITKTSLLEYCNYKIFIEAYGLTLCLAGLATTLVFPQLVIFNGIAGIFFIVRLNWLLLIKKKAYSLNFPEPEYIKNPLVSIVIIAYNEEKYIGNTLKSLAAQTYHNFEAVLVDDHSTDSTMQIAQSFSTLFPLRIVQKEVRGCSRSRNYGAANSNGDIILFIDADIILPPDFLEKSLQEFASQKLSIAFFDFNPITDKAIDHYMTWIYRIWLKITQYFNPRAIGSCIMVDKKLHRRILFDETVVMAEDFDYVRRAVKYGKFRMINNPRYLVSWRRFGVENRFWLLVKYLLFEAHRQLIGEIRKPIMSYDFGHYDKKKE